MKKFMLLIACLSAIAAGSAQIRPGEKLVYGASYNMAGMMTQLAQVTLETSSMATAKGKYLHLSLEAATYSKWDSYFKIRDLYESYVYPQTLMPALYKRDISEGGYTKKEKYVFKGNAVTATAQKRNKPQTVRTFRIGAGTQDVVSMLYKLRTIDFGRQKPGQSTAFTIVFDEKEVAVVVKYMGTEAVAAGNLGTKNCYKLSVAARTDALRGKDKNLIWLTADAARVPAMIRFSIPVGTGQLSLKSASGY
jgi:hypothetical protein